MNITAFMNLMVILVPFLLITAVFSRLAVLQLALPAGDDAAVPAPETQQLQVTVRHDRIEVAGLGIAPQVIENAGTRYDLKRLSKTLQVIKARNPDERGATVLLEFDIPYETVVRVMDRVRAATVLRATAAVPVELFPDIAIGDAPPLATTGAAPR